VTRCRRQPRHLLLFWLPFALLALALPEIAAAQPVLLVQDDLADLGLGEVTGRDWTTTPRADVQRQFCSVRTDAPARLALASQKLTRRQRDACAMSKGGKLVEGLIGRRALIAMTSGATFGLTPDILYRALAREVPEPDGKLAPNRTMRWHELDAGLPDVPIRVLLPPVSSIESRIVSEIILYEGCARARTILPADPIKRLATCTSLRTDSVVSRVNEKQTVSAWLHKQGAAAVALVGVAVLLAEPDLQTALPIDGVTPSFANIADGHYRAVLPVYLLTEISPSTARTIAGIAGPLLAEAAIGPLGKLPRRGLAPLAAADRVKLRLNLGREFEDAAE
jgi:phosphate transport system substrate-binding protein